MNIICEKCDRTMKFHHTQFLYKCPKCGMTVVIEEKQDQTGNNHIYSEEDPRIRLTKPDLKATVNQMGTVTELEVKHKDDDPIGYCKKCYPEMINKILDLQQEDFELFCKKQMDYGTTNIAPDGAMEDEKQFKLYLEGLVWRMHDKAERLFNLLIVQKRTPKNEPIIDSFRDLSIYGYIARILINKLWGK